MHNLSIICFAKQGFDANCSERKPEREYSEGRHNEDPTIMETECSGYDGEANCADCSDQVDKAEGVDVRKLRQEELQDAKVDDELLQCLVVHVVRGVGLGNGLQSTLQARPSTCMEI